METESAPQTLAAADGGEIRAPRRRCPRHGFTMQEASADPKTGQGRIMRCTVEGCYMVAPMPGWERLRRVLLNRKQREWAEAKGKRLT